MSEPFVNTCREPRVPGPGEPNNALEVYDALRSMHHVLREVYDHGKYSSRLDDVIETAEHVLYLLEGECVRIETEE